MLPTFSKKRFVDSILDGTKIHTIREDKNHRWKEGMKIHFWYKNPRNVHLNPYRFATGEADKVMDITISFIFDWFKIGYSGYINDLRSLETLAKSDGFENWLEMKQFFNCDIYKGRIIYWKNLKAEK